MQTAAQGHSSPSSFSLADSGFNTGDFVVDWAPLGA